jgi:hypothetical protein
MVLYLYGVQVFLLRTITGISRRFAGLHNIWRWSGTQHNKVTLCHHLQNRVQVVPDPLDYSCSGQSSRCCCCCECPFSSSSFSLSLSPSLSFPLSLSLFLYLSISLLSLFHTWRWLHRRKLDRDAISAVRDWGRQTAAAGLGRVEVVSDSGSAEHTHACIEPRPPAKPNTEEKGRGRGRGTREWHIRLRRYRVQALLTTTLEQASQRAQTLTKSKKMIENHGNAITDGCNRTVRSTGVQYLPIH